MLFLSTSLNNEMLFVLLILILLLLTERIRRRPGWGDAAMWGAVAGIACLIRVDSALTVGLLGIFLLIAVYAAAVGVAY